jgi:hypothetical protein
MNITGAEEIAVLAIEPPELVWNQLKMSSARYDRCVIRNFSVRREFYDGSRFGAVTQARADP